MLLRFAALVACLTLAAAQQSFSYQGYLPILAPTTENGWVAGQVNVLQWDVGWSAMKNGLPPSFDIRLAHPFSTNPPLFIATKVDREAKSLGVFLDGTVPTGDGFYLHISDTYSGQVFATSDRFSIAAADSGTKTATGLPSPKATATLGSANDNPARYATTLNGKPLPTFTDTAKKVYYASSARPVLHGGPVGPFVAALALGAVAAGALLA